MQAAKMNDRARCRQEERLPIGEPAPELMPLRIIEPIGVVACGEDCQIIYGQPSGLAFRFDELTQDPARLEWRRLLLRPGLGQAFGAVLYRAPLARAVV